jgi:alanyl aminopeptidase
MHRFISSMALAFALVAPALSHAADADPVPQGRLPRTVVPLNVAVELKIDPSEKRFSGQVHIDARVATATSSFWLHGRELTIASALVTPQGGKPLVATVTPADVGAGVLKLTTPQPIPAGKVRIDIAYDAPFGQLQGAYRVKAGGDDYVITQMEPIGARNAFPGFDEPSFKQPWDFSLTIPEKLQGVANTRLVKTMPAEAGWKKLVFARTEALPSYLIAFAVGPWDIVDGPVIPPNAVRKTPLALRGIAPRGQGERMRYTLANTGAIVAAEEAYFGIAYPFDKLDLLAAPDFWAGAMENAGLIVYRDVLMYVDDKSAVGLRQGFWETHAHELAHQWFGDYVTMPWWDDIWLNEAFATWMAAKVVGDLKPEFFADRGLMEGAIWAMGQDSLASTRRIHDPIERYTDIMSAFDGITYQKGGAVLSMFERYVGPDRFRDAIRGYMKQHARGNATSADLVSAIAARSSDPKAVRSAFSSFIEQPGVPMVGVSVDCTGPKPELKLSQQRFLPVGSTAPAKGEWEIPMCVRWGDAKGTGSQCGLVKGRTATLPLKAASCPAWVMPNAAGAGYFRFALAPADAAKLEANFNQLDEREQRAYADSVTAAFNAGALDAAGFLRAAAKLSLAPVRQTATAPLGRLEWMLRRLATTPQDKQALRDFIGRLYAPRLASLGTEPRPGDSDEDRLLRNTLLEATAEVARDPALRAALAAKGRRVIGLQGADAATPGDGQLNPDAAAADQRALALRVAMDEGDAPVYEALLKHGMATQDAALRGQLLGALGSARQPELKQRSRAMVLTGEGLRRNEFELVLGAFRRPAPMAAEEEAAASQAARDWLDTNFDTLAARIAPGGSALVYLYSEGMCSAEESDLLQAKLAERAKPLEGGPRAIAQTSEGVKLCAALKARQQTAGLRIP